MIKEKKKAKLILWKEKGQSQFIFDYNSYMLDNIKPLCHKKKKNIKL